MSLNFLCRSLSSAKAYASVAVNAVSKYREIYRLINSSLDATSAANRTSNEMLGLVRFKTVLSLILELVIPVVCLFYFDTPIYGF